MILFVMFDNCTPFIKDENDLIGNMYVLPKYKNSK